MLVENVRKRANLSELVLLGVRELTKNGRRTNPGAIIARREFKDADSGEAIEATISMPEEDPNSRYGDWLVRVQIRTNGKTEETTGHGVDSLQAILSGLGALRFALRGRARKLVWTGVPGNIGLPLMVHDEDQDFLALVEHLLAAEHSRQLVAAKRARSETRKRKRHRK